MAAPFLGLDAQQPHLRSLRHAGASYWQCCLCKPGCSCWLLRCDTNRLSIVMRAHCLGLTASSGRSATEGYQKSGRCQACIKQSHRFASSCIGSAMRPSTSGHSLRTAKSPPVYLSHSSSCGAFPGKMHTCQRDQDPKVPLVCL